MAERVQRYTEAERAGQRANSRERNAGAKYGASYASQGLKPIAEQGKSFLAKQEVKAKYGAFASPQWDYKVENGVVYQRPLANQSGRIAAQGGTSPQWEQAPSYVQKSYSNPQRQQFFAQHAQDFAGRPGGGQDAWLYQKYMNRLKTDPTTGFKVNQSGELYDPNVMFGANANYGGGAVGAAGIPGFDYGSRGAGPQGGQGWMQPQGGGFGGYYNGGGYYGQPIPGYAMPGTLGQMYGYQPRQQGPTSPLNYRTMQQQGGSSFGSYPPAQPYSPFQAYQPGYSSGSY